MKQNNRNYNNRGYTEEWRQYEYHEAKSPTAAELASLGADGWLLSEVIPASGNGKERWIFYRPLAPKRVAPIELKAAQPGTWTIGPSEDIVAATYGAGFGGDEHGRK